MPEIKETLRLEGVVDKIMFRNASNGYVALDLDVGNDCVTAVGELGNIEEGEELVLTGEYYMHPKFGAQFKASVCERKMPETSSAILKYLSSGVIKGIGPTLAKRIVEEFGADSLEIIESRPEELIKVKGMTESRIEQISLEFKKIFGIRALMIFLSGYGIQPATAVLAWKRWGTAAIDVIRENPYMLCEAGIELEFEKAEAMAARLDIPKDSEYRIKAGIFHVLIENAYNKGHTCLPKDRLIGMSASVLGVGAALCEETAGKEADDGNLAFYNKNNRAFVYLEDYYRAESYISSRISVMKDCFKDTGTDFDKLIELEEMSRDISYAGQQKKAISLALSQGFMILTGGPGTGKTTALKAIISLYEQQGMRVMISAPTGKAAKRISDLTGYEAKTIHRALGAAFDSGGNFRFKYNERDTLSCDVMIVDEMSMIDAVLFEALLRALSLSCRLIMVGDSDQLPSVGAGNVLGDMIDSGNIPVVRLSEIFRQASQSLIITNAHKIVRGEDPDMSRADNDFFFLQRLDDASVSETVIELITERLPSAYGFSALDDIQVLCPSRKGLLGTYEMNRRLQEAVNPQRDSAAEVKTRFFTFRDGDKVMQIKNNYDAEWTKDGEKGQGIFNGDIGTVVKVMRSESRIIIDFDRRIADYSFESLDQLELAYAITVHKSQGSEFNAVIMPLLGGFERLYYRNLLYTAVTRAKKLLVIVGSSNVVKRMVENDRQTLRYSCLKDMIAASS